MWNFTCSEGHSWTGTLDQCCPVCEGRGVQRELLAALNELTVAIKALTLLLPKREES